MHRYLWVVALIFALGACQAEPQNSGFSGAERPVVFVTTPEINLEERGISLSSDGFNVRMSKPNQWESFTTEYGVVLGEQFGSVASGGQLEGVMAYIFATPVTDFIMPASDDGQDNMAYHIQKQIVTSEEYIGSAEVSAPTPFEWDGHQASYYLLHDAELDINTMVIGVYVPASGLLFTCSVSAPVTQAERIRAMLPTLMQDLDINGRNLSAMPIEQLPNPLDFPN